LGQRLCPDNPERARTGCGALSLAAKQINKPITNAPADTPGKDLTGRASAGRVAGGDWTRISAVVGGAVGGSVDAIMKPLPDIIQLGMDIVMSIGRAITDK